MTKTELTKAEKFALTRSPRLAFEHFAVGSEWLYRKSTADDPTQVRVLRVGEQRPVRVKVEFLDDRFEGLREWVTTAALHVPWADRATYLAEDDRWSKLLAESPGKALVQTLAGSIIEPHVDSSVFEVLEGDRTSAAIVHDADALIAQLGVTSEDLHDRLGWDEGGARVVSWVVVARVARALARRHGNAAALELARASAQRLAEYLGAVRDRLIRVDAETPDHRGLRLTMEHHEALLDLLGDWIGEDLVRPALRYLELYDELQEARALLARTVPNLVRMGRRVDSPGLVEDIREFNRRLR